MYDISAIGVSVRVIAVPTMPSGFTVTEFADDLDPFDFPEMAIAEASMNANGDLISWSAPQPIQFALSVIPGSDADLNLEVIFEANRAGKDKMHAGDEIIIVGSYPDGSSVSLSEGKMLTGVPSKSPSTDGRIKSATYTFAFQNLSRTRG